MNHSKLYFLPKYCGNPCVRGTLVCPFVAHANVQGYLFSWKKSGSVKQEGVSGNINQQGPFKI